MPFINVVWSSPFQIIMAIYFLWQEIGIASLAGIGVLFLLFPINFLVGRIVRSLNIQQMKLKDERIKDRCYGDHILYATKFLCQKNFTPKNFYAKIFYAKMCLRQNIVLRQNLFTPKYGFTPKKCSRHNCFTEKIFYAKIIFKQCKSLTSI